MKNQIIVVVPLVGILLIGRVSLLGAQATRTPPAKGGAPQPPAPVPQTQEAAVNQVLDELKHIYADVGTLSWDQAKALIAQRKLATQELENRLAGLGPRGARALAAGFAQADNPRAKLLIVHGLGKIGDTEAVGVLQDVLASDGSFSVQKEVVRALGQRDEAAAEQALTGILAHQDSQLRFAAAQALSKRKNAVRALAEQIKRETSPQVRSELIRSVGLIGNQEAMDALVEVAQGPMDSAVRKTAIQELSRSFGGSARDLLDKLSNDPDEEIRNGAAKATARMKGVVANAKP